MVNHCATFQKSAQAKGWTWHRSEPKLSIPATESPCHWTPSNQRSMITCSSGPANNRPNDFVHHASNLGETAGGRSSIFYAQKCRASQSEHPTVCCVHLADVHCSIATRSSLHLFDPNVGLARWNHPDGSATWIGEHCSDGR